MKKIFLTLLGITCLSNFAVGDIGDDMGKAVCSNWYKSYLGYLGSVGEPLGVGWIINIGGQVIEDTCPSDNTVDARIDDLTSAIQDVNDKAAALKFDLGNLQSKSNSDKVIEARGRFNYRLELFDRIIDTYQNVYTGDGSSSSSLTSFLKNSINKDGSRRGFKDLLDNYENFNSVEKTAEQVNAFKDILTDDAKNEFNDLNLFYGALEEMCSNPDGIESDVLAKRKQCNGIIDSTIAKVMLRADVFRKTESDVINTVLSAVNLGDIDEYWLNTTKGLKFNLSSKIALQSWLGASAEVDAIINNKIKKMQDTLLGTKGSKKFNPLKGFSTDLINSMKENACTNNHYDDKNYLGYYSNDGQVIRSEPRISKWISKLGTYDPYIETFCPSRVIDSDLSFVKDQYSVKSLYYLNGGDFVINVLGNLVAAKQDGAIKNIADAEPVQVSNYQPNGDWINIKFFLILNYPVVYNAQDLVTSMLLPQMGKNDGRRGIVTPVTYGRLDGNTWYFDNIQQKTAKLLVPNPYPTMSGLTPYTLFSDIPFLTDSMYFYELGYLAVDLDGVRHAFGLRYHYKHISRDIFSGANTREYNIKLVCLDTNQCQTTGTGIKWRDGNRANLSFDSAQGWIYSTAMSDGAAAPVKLTFYNKDGVEYKK